MVPPRSACAAGPSLQPAAGSDPVLAMQGSSAASPAARPNRACAIIIETARRSWRPAQGAAVVAVRPTWRRIAECLESCVDAVAEPDGNSCRAGHHLRVRARSGPPPRAVATLDLRAVAKLRCNPGSTGSGAIVEADLPEPRSPIWGAAGRSSNTAGAAMSSPSFSSRPSPRPPLCEAYDRGRQLLPASALGGSAARRTPLCTAPAK